MEGIAASSRYKFKVPFASHWTQIKCFYSTKFNPSYQQTRSTFSSWSTSGHMLWFWLTSDGHYSLYDDNNNFNAVLMIVIIMLGTHSPNSVLRAVWQPQWGVSELTSKVWFTSQWSAGHCSTSGRLSFSWWTSPFLILLFNISAVHRPGTWGRREWRSLWRSSVILFLFFFLSLNYHIHVESL